MSLNNQPLSGIGITLSLKFPGSSVFVALAQLQDDCEFDGFDTTIIPIKTLSQTVLTKVPGRTDPGTFTGNVYLIIADSGVAELHTLRTSRQTVAWQLQLVDGSSGSTGSTYAFSGFISNLKPGNFTGDDTPNLGFTIAISGDVVMTAGT